MFQIQNLIVPFNESVRFHYLNKFYQSSSVQEKCLHYFACEKCCTFCDAVHWLLC